MIANFVKLIFKYLSLDVNEIRICDLLILSLTNMSQLTNHWLVSCFIYCHLINCVQAKSQAYN